MVDGDLDVSRGVVVEADRGAGRGHGRRGGCAPPVPGHRPAVQARRRCRQALARISPDLLRQRAKRAREACSLRRWVDEPGVDRWDGAFPSEQAAEGWAAVDALARRYVAEGRCQRVDAARAQALMDLIRAQTTIDVQARGDRPRRPSSTPAPLSRPNGPSRQSGPSRPNRPSLAPLRATPEVAPRSEAVGSVRRYQPNRRRDPRRPRTWRGSPVPRRISSRSSASSRVSLCWCGVDGSGPSMTPAPRGRPCATPAAEPCSTARPRRRRRTVRTPASPRSCARGTGAAGSPGARWRLGSPTSTTSGHGPPDPPRPRISCACAVGTTGSSSAPAGASGCARTPAGVVRPYGPPPYLAPTGPARPRGPTRATGPARAGLPGTQSQRPGRPHLLRCCSRSSATTDLLDTGRRQVFAARECRVHRVPSRRDRPGPLPRRTGRPHPTSATPGGSGVQTASALHRSDLR